MTVDRAARQHRSTATCRASCVCDGDELADAVGAGAADPWPCADRRAAGLAVRPGRERPSVGPESPLAATEGCEIAPAHGPHPQAEGQVRSRSQVKSSQQVEPLIHKPSQFSVEIFYMALSCLRDDTPHCRTSLICRTCALWPVVTNLSLCGLWLVRFGSQAYMASRARHAMVQPARFPAGPSGTKLAGEPDCL